MTRIQISQEPLTDLDNMLMRVFFGQILILLLDCLYN
jgi:hypothetical protein